MEESCNLFKRISVFNSLANQLSKVDVIIEEEDKTLILLTFVHDSCYNLVTTILYDKTTIKMEEVVSVFLSHG